MKSNKLTVNIAGYDVNRHTLETYLRSCKYNQSTGTEESDRMQKKLNRELVESAGIDRTSVTRDDRKFLFELDIFVSDTLSSGY